MTWTDIATWVFDGPCRNLWPLLVLPALAGRISDRCARFFPVTGVAPFQAAALTALPGAVTLGLASVALAQGLTRGLPDTPRDMILGVVTPAVAASIILYASCRALLRHLAMKRLCELSEVPGPRLAAASAVVGVRAREIRIRDPECFIVGLVRPTAYVSRGALDRLSDAELRAVLHHERAHARSHDPATLSVLSFLADLAPTTGRAFEAYRRAREQCADQAAVRQVGPLVLASALLAMVRSHAGLPAVSMSSMIGAWRLELMLGLTTPAPLSRQAHRRIRMGLFANVLLAAWPLPQIALLYIFCSS